MRSHSSPRLDACIFDVHAHEGSILCRMDSYTIRGLKLPRESAVLSMAPLWDGLADILEVLYEDIYSGSDSIVSRCLHAPTSSQ